MLFVLERQSVQSPDLNLFNGEHILTEAELDDANHPEFKKGSDADLGPRRRRGLEALLVADGAFLAHRKLSRKKSRNWHRSWAMVDKAPHKI